MTLNYFQVICFIWALIGVGSRIIMGIMGDKWKTWELNSAYSEKKPKILTLIGLLGYALVGFTWYKVFESGVENSWIIAALTTVTLIKISVILFNYNKFRTFAKNTLNHKKKMAQLNMGVIIFSIILLLMGIYLY